MIAQDRGVTLMSPRRHRRDLFVHKQENGPGPIAIILFLVLIFLLFRAYSGAEVEDAAVVAAGGLAR